MLAALLAAAAPSAAQLNYATPYTFFRFAGGGISFESGSADGTGTDARFNNPFGIAVDGSGTAYVADTLNHTIRQISPAGVVTTFAGSAGLTGHVNATGTAARFNAPRGVALDAAGNVFVADTNNHVIRRITPAGVVTTFAGRGTSGYVNATGAAAAFTAPQFVAVDAAGTVYVTETDAVRRISAAGAVTTLAGPPGPTRGSGYVNGPGAVARFDVASGIAVDGGGNLYVADFENNAIRLITPAGAVSTYAGPPPPASGLAPSGAVDGTGSAARFWFPSGVALDAAGNLFIAEARNMLIRKIAPGGIVTTLAGRAGLLGSSDGTGSDAMFRAPRGIAMQGDAVYVAETGGNSIRLRADVSTKGRLSNLAIRSHAGTGAEELIVGFVVGGTGTTGTKPLLIRGVGPALGVFGVPGFLVDPELSLLSGGSVLASNDNWGGDAQIVSVGASVGAFAFPSPTSLDAAIHRPAQIQGPYTVRLVGVGGRTGVALAEIYDATSPASFATTTPRLVNVSARTRVGTGAEILIAGFSIGGTTPMKILVRAIGPGLAQFGVPGVLEDPLLNISLAGTVLYSNDNWGGGAAIQGAADSVGAFRIPSASRDAALLVTLTPGSYTAEISGPPAIPGLAAGTGVALVEVYEVP